MNAPTQNLQDFKDFLDCLPGAVTFSRLTDGEDSIVWQHDWTGALVKQFNHRLTVLSLQDLRAYHALHRSYSNKPVEIKTTDKLPFQYMGEPVRRVRVIVLELGDKIAQRDDLLISEIPYIKGENLINGWKNLLTSVRDRSNSGVDGGYILEIYIHKCLEYLGVPIQQYNTNHPEHCPGYNITRDNLMIEKLENGILTVYLTDMGFCIEDALKLPISSPL